MAQRRRWALPLLVGLILSLMCAFFVARDVRNYRLRVREAFHASCLMRAMAFEDSAETWLVRDETRSLDAAAKLLLMGSGLYVDVVMDGKIVVTGRDEGVDVEPIRADGEAARAVVRDRPGQVAEARVPLTFAGYPDRPVGFVRIGFSGDYPAEQVRRRTLVSLGIGLGCFFGALGLLGVGLWSFMRGDRAPSDRSSVIRCGSLCVDLRAREARLGSERLDLTPKLYELLLLFAMSPGEVYSDKAILESVWTDSLYAASADVKQHIYLLRRKLGAVHPNPKSVIVNVKGFGYRLDPPGRSTECAVDAPVDGHLGST